MRLLAAPDKFAGTLSARQAAAAAAQGAQRVGWLATTAPLSDGGEGLGEVLGGDEIETVVTGPLGTLVPSRWRRSSKRDVAIIEMADAAGRSLLSHPEATQPLDATTRGVGELIVEARDAGCTRVIVGCGGSATTDGGRGCVEAILDAGGLGEISELIVATDVTTRYLDAARVFGPQKGATPEQVATLTTRLADDAHWLQSITGRSIVSLDRSGAAGGLAGGLAALGGSLVSGFDLVALSLNLADLIGTCDVLMTGEGRIDQSTLEGKAIDSLLAITPRSLPVLIIAGEADMRTTEQLRGLREGPTTICSLVADGGRHRAFNDTAAAITDAVALALSTW